jgi:LmbE family N-acetylglucosaminyl deacetylase
VAAPGEGRLALVWAPAVERGFAPALLPAPPPSLNATDRVLVLAAHPDDETVSNGGLILAARAVGAKVNVLWATDGERNPWAQLAHEGRWPVSASDRARWAALRRGESRAALRVLGAADAGETWLGLRDRGLTRQWMSGDERLADSILSAIRKFRPTMVSAPSLFDSHPDHSLLGLAAETALARLEGSAPQPRLIEYCTHNTDLAPGATLRLRLPPDAQTRKLRAIECIPSQLHWRRRELTAFADSVECFDPPDIEVARLQTHRVRGAWIDGDRIVVDFVGGRWPSLGPLTLRVSCEGTVSPLRRFTIVLPARAGDIQVQDGADRAHSGPARLSRVRDGWRLELPLGLDASPLNTYVKIERPLELACGFFDESGWWPVEKVTRGTVPPRSSGGLR